MTKLDINLEKLIKEAVIEEFDEDRFIERISMDICESNPEWWSDKVVKNLKGALNKAILNNKEFIKEIIWEYMDREFYDAVKEEVRKCVEDRIMDMVKGLEIRVETGN